MDREFRDIITPIGNKTIKLKSWLTGGEKLSLAKIDREDRTASAKLLIEGVVEGTTFDEIMNMHGKDFDFIMLEITGVIEGSSLSPKALDSSASTAD